MKFAVFTGSTPEYTPEEAVGLFKELGYDGVEWRVVDQAPSPNGQPDFWKGNRCTLALSTFVDEAPRIRALTERAGLGMPGVGSYALCDDLSSVEQVFTNEQPRRDRLRDDLAYVTGLHTAALANQPLGVATGVR